VDFLRGLAMAAMALDHVRMFFMNAAPDPTDLSRTSVQYFMTGWVTYFCAPVFVFLTGTGAYFMLGSTRDPERVGRFLLVRGLWLVFLELTVMQFIWNFRMNPHFITGQVLWAIGVSMIALSFLVRLPSRWVAALGVAVIAGHNAFDGVRPENLGAFGPVWTLLHTTDVIDLGHGYSFHGLYPLLPWIGIAAAGFGFGEIYTQKAGRRKRLLLWTGLGAVVAFLALRLLNLYGDPLPWTVQKDAVFTALSFLNCEKYPPSLLFSLMTLGPAILVLALCEYRVLPSYQPFVVLGRASLFYYLLHVPFIHSLWLIFSALDFHAGMLALTYLVWIIVVTVLLPLCYWFADVKRDRPYFWLSYL
jgi:uncharacterized membrane protein